MEKVDKTALYNEYERCYREARSAENHNAFGKARTLYKAACESLITLAQHSPSEYTQAYMKKVDEIVKKVATFPDSPDMESGSDARNSGIRHGDDDETRFFSATIPSITFDDVAGLDDVKKAISTRIIKPRQYPEVYKALNKKPGGGVLMYGSPGTGKTMVAKAIANEVGAAFYEVKCSQIVQKYFGVAERNVKNLFETARQHEVAIIFFDEFESLGAKRGGNSEVMNRLVPELLSQIDGFTGTFNTLLIIAATNRPWDIDSAFLRPGRFSELLYIPLPDQKARQHIINKSYRGITLEEGIDIEELASKMEGFSGADVAEFCDRSKDPAADRCIDDNDGDISTLIITKADIEETASRIADSVMPKDLTELESFRTQFHKF